MTRHPWYPLHTRKLGYRWHDPHAENPLEHGPVIDIQVFIDPGMYQPERLIRELKHALAQIIHHVESEIPHAQNRPSQGGSASQRG